MKMTELKEMVESLRYSIDMGGIAEALEYSWDEIRNEAPNLYYLITQARRGIDELMIELENEDELYGEWVHS